MEHENHNELLNCETVIWRIGEIFGEFGLRLVDQATSGTSNPLEIEKWHLRITTEARDTVFDEEMQTTSLSKVVKLKPSTAYLVQGRVFSVKLGLWGEWSKICRTRTFAPVVTSISEIGEDYARFQWDRPLRDNTLIEKEQMPDAMTVVAEVSQFQLRVVREVDMLQEFCDEFPTGVRTYTLHELRPGTAYIVFARYSTLIGTLKQWNEVCRFYTQPSHELTVSSRGEDEFTVAWARSLLPSTIGYLLPDSSIHKFELSVEGIGDAIETVDPDPFELPSSVNSHRFDQLNPSSSYRVRLRCLTKEGRWGSHTKPLVVRVAERPLPSALCIGETFASYSWNRATAEEDTAVEYQLRSIRSSFEKSHTLQLDPSGKKEVHIEGLTSDCDYSIRIRTLLGDVWGRWSEAETFSTHPRCNVTLVERGENFLTVELSEKPASTPAHVVVTRTEDDEIVLDEEVTSLEDMRFRISDLDADCQYQIKARVWQVNSSSGFEGWGEFSHLVCAQTLRSVALQVLDVGEDFVQMSWRRALSVTTETNWVDLKYELVLGCMETGEDAVIHREVLDTTYTIDNLAPATSYVVSVRACDDKEQWGSWCKIQFRTLAPITADVHEIGEDFMRLVWERVPDETPKGTVTAETYVSKYSLFVFSDDCPSEEPHEPSGYKDGGASEIQVLKEVPSHHTSFRITDLQPDRTYVAVVRAATMSGKWGLWCDPIKFRTVSPFRIPANSLSIGENYVHLVWDRDENPGLPDDIRMGDYTVTSQQLRVKGVDIEYTKDHTLPADHRELKMYGLAPATAYSIQIRACNKSGDWGLWSTAVYVMTRATIACRPLEVAEDYLVIAWEKKKAANPHNYPTGKGFITSYHLRVSNHTGVHTDTYLGDGDCPYRVSGLEPDTFYCVELKANYNGEEWGLWSTALWCLTMKHLTVSTDLISEEFCNIRIARPQQPRRLPEDDGNRPSEDRAISFGQVRPLCLLRVTSAAQVSLPHSSAVKSDDPQERLIYQAELSGENEDITHTIPNLKSDTIYSVTVRSKLRNGDWGMWSPPQKFMTVSPISVSFVNIGENMITVDWRRRTQHIPVQVPKIASGLGLITKSRLKIRDQTGSFQQLHEIDSVTTTITIDDLNPATTYQITVQTFNDNHDWGVWSEEARVRTVPAMVINVENISEDAVWLSWMRKWDPQADLTHGTTLNVDTVVKAYEMKIIGDGHFCYSRELEGQNCFFRGLRPDTVYEVRIRALSKHGQWGMWSHKSFRTIPQIRVTFGNIGEHFAVVEWRRHLPAAVKITSDEIVEAQDLVQEFRMKVERVGHEPLVYELSPTISSFRLADLDPSTEYRVWMCARGHEGVWGLWNQETRVRTLPQLELDFVDVGEEYVSVQWNRAKWIGESAPMDPDSDTKTYKIEGSVSAFQVRVVDEEGNTVTEVNTGFQQKKCTLEHLELRTMYSVMVRAKDSYGSWGLWSEPHKFATLPPVETNLLGIGEDFVRLQWDRRTRLKKRKPPHAETEEVHDVEQFDEDDSEEYEEEEYDEEQESASQGPADEEPADTASEVFDMDTFGDDIYQGDEDVKQWHVRVYSSRLFGGQPGADDFKEFFVEPSCTEFDIADLLPSTTYTIAVRAQNLMGNWGRWSLPQTIETMALIRVDVTYIAENFVTVNWHRPEMAEEYHPYHNFPPATAIHNYKVQIQPLATEASFDDSEEELVDGSRQYETSQPSLRLQNLRSGTRYRIMVREQMFEPDSRTLGDYGIASEQKVVETIEPMVVSPSEVGENFAEVSWQRGKREKDENDDAITITRTTAKIMKYELKIVRMDDAAEEPVLNDLKVTKTFGVATQSFAFPNLVPNAIYAVQVRAQTAGEHWGLWSATTKFITQKRLTLRVELVNEDNFLVSWARMLPDWMKDKPTSVVHHTVSDEASSMVEDGVASTQADTMMDVRSDALSDNASAADIIAAAPPSAISTLESVRIGDYGVKLYEVEIHGIGNAFSQTLNFPSANSTARVSGLSHNSIYTISVRSKSTKDKWSLFSGKVSVCTLKPMDVKVVKNNECMASLKWFRESQSVSEHEKVLKKCQLDIQREMDSEAKTARMQRQQRRQERDTTGVEDDDDDDEDVYSTARHKAAVEEALMHLHPDNVQIGCADTTGYQIRLLGEGGTPFVKGTSHILTQKRSRRGKKGVTFRGAGSPSRFGKKRSTFVESKQEPTKDEDEDANADDEQILLDLKINSKTTKLDIHGLLDNTPYDYCIRSRNNIGEWGPWCPSRSFTTLNALQLQHSRFGEHYINLYWHRIADDAKSEIEKQEEIVAEDDQYNEMTAEDITKIKDTVSKEEYDAFIGKLMAWKSTQRALQKWKTNLIEGGGEVITAENTPIAGYHLRVIHEDGTIVDNYFPEGGAGSHQYTVTGLHPNHMYVVMMCADYGNGEWGSWSPPIKFMTQNLIQLNMTYVGESFVDIEWKRAPNKRCLDPSVQLNPTAQGQDHQYQVAIKHIENGVHHALEPRTVKDSNVYRIDQLDNDCHYEICVREWDPKGEWGMWSSPKSCTTLAGMKVTINEIGENWMHISWIRQKSTAVVDPDDPQLVQLPVDSEAYYVRVEELRDNGTDEDLLRIEAEEEEENNRQVEDDEEDADTEFAEFFSSTRDLQLGGPVPPMPPPQESTEAPDGRYLLVKRFNYDVTDFRLDDLRPDRYYNVQVLCETSGAQIGSWSPDQNMLTLAKVRIRAALIDEECVRLTWQRDPPRPHPRLNVEDIVTGSYFTDHYVLEARGLQPRCEKYNFTSEFNRNVSEWKLDDLRIDSLYTVRIKSVDTQNRTSMWSDDLNFVTLKPLRVLPALVTEHSMQVEWGREPQLESEYPACDPPPVIAMEKANQYHLRVFAFDERNLPIVDKQFSGAVSKFQLATLRPNTAYIVQARSCNVIGEWGLWSEERVVYTMKLMSLKVMAVGEDYIMVNWGRDKPDELQEMVQIEPSAEDQRRLSEDEDALQALQIKKKYPLLDVPENVPTVYATDRTKILRFALSVTKHEESEGWVAEIPYSATDCSFTIPGLRPDSQYVIAIRAKYGDEEWGTWSEPIDSGTLNLLMIDVKHIGEDYLNAAWQRALNSFNVADVQMGKPEETLCYQFLIHDFTDVPIGEEGAAKLDELCVKETMTKKKNVLAKELKPNRRYRLAVRRWYRPVTINIEGSPTAPVVDSSDKPMTEEQRLQQEVAHAGGVAGGWSEGVFVLTLKEMVVLIDDIAEDFMCLRWERDPNAVVLPTRQCLKVATVVHSYHIRIDEMLPDASDVDNNPDTVHIDSQFGPDDTSFRVTDLKPDGVYKVDVRCCADNSWGQWSKEVVVVTLPKLTVTISSIGEEYVNLSWERKIRNITLPNGGKALSGTTNSVDRYQLELYGLEHAFRLEKKFKASRTSYRVKRLEAQTLYCVAVRSCDSTNIWSLWSDRLNFATLKPVQLSFGKVGEQFVHVSWSREPQSSDEYASSYGAVELGSTSVISYHLCVFSMDHSPSAALIDKQFSGQTTQYRVSGLNPNSSYIVIVRACNSEKQWGLWSEEKVVTTLRLIHTQVVSIGESYLTVKWSRDDNDMLPVDSSSPLGIRVDPTQYHLCVTSENENIDRNFLPDECVLDNGVPHYTVRNLVPDTRYIVAIQGCYGDDEWGTWTKPLTIVTLNKISITVNNISEEKADFTWGRAQQSPVNAYDPNAIVWRGTIMKYQLVIRKLQQVRAAEQRNQERLLKANQAGEEGREDGVTVIPDQDDDPADTPADEDEIRIEREMEVKQAKYVQTFCSVDQLQVNTDYHVQVRALDDRSEWGEWSELIFDTPPNVPTNPTLKKSGAQYVLFSWEAPDQFTRYSYCVEQAIIKDGPKKPGKTATTSESLDWRVVENVEEPSCRLRAFGPLNKIRCRVKCCKIDKPAHLFSKYSVVASLAQVAPPEPVANLTLTSLSKTTASLQWGPPTTDTSDPVATQVRLTYRVLSAPEKQQPSLLASTRNTTFDMTDLKASTTYRIQVQAESENGISSRNVMLKFTTKPEGDRTISRATPGQPPLAQTIAATDDGVRLPTIPQPKASASSRRSRVAIQQKDPHHTPRPPPAREPGAKRVAPHPPPKMTKTEKEKAHQRGAARRLKPVSAQAGAPPEGTDATVEEYDVVAFDASDDEKD